MEISNQHPNTAAPTSKAPSHANNVSPQHPHKNFEIEDTYSPQLGTATEAYHNQIHPDPQNNQVEGAPEDEKDLVDEFQIQLDEFQAAIRKELLDSILESIDPETKNMLVEQFKQDHVMYEVEEGVEAAEVPDYWNSENTSQRIVDFAMSFADENSSPEFLEELRGAVMEGFAQAKELLGDIPGEAGKLFNDTYEAAMLKFDELLEKYESPADLISQEIQEMTQTQAYTQNYQQSPATSAPSHQLELVA